MTLTTDIEIDTRMSIDVDTTQVRTKRTGLVKVKRDLNDMRPTPVAAYAHIANEPEQPEWPQFRFSNDEIAGTVIAIVAVLPSIALLGWIIFGGLS